MQSGDEILIYDEEMEVQATVDYDVSTHYWLATPEWSTKTLIVH